MSKRGRQLAWGGAGLLLVMAAAWLIYRTAGCDAVTYKLTSSSQAQVSITTLQVDLWAGPAAHEVTVVPPWETTVCNDHLVQLPAASMRAAAADRSAQLTCEVWVNGSRMDQRSANGAVGCLYDPNQAPGR